MSEIWVETKNGIIVWVTNDQRDAAHHNAVGGNAEKYMQAALTEQDRFEIASLKAREAALIEKTHQQDLSIIDLKRQLAEARKDAERYRVAVLYLMAEGIDECWQENYCEIEGWSAREGAPDGIEDDAIINGVFDSMKKYWPDVYSATTATAPTGGKDE